MPTRLACIAAATALSVPALAQTTWTSFEDRKGHAIASDPTGGVLMFGGEASTSSGKLLKDTNSFATTGAGSSLTSTWLKLNPFGSPTARTEHAMASGVGTDDTAIFVLFGGLAEPNTSGPAIPSGETFVYQGGGWGKVTLAVAPSARTGHTLVTDPISNRVLMFGGASSGFAQNDTWEFDPAGETWQQIIASGVPSSPPPRFDHAMVFHPGFGGTTGRFYLCGGAPFFADTWEYDPNTQTWTNVTPASAPSGRRRASMSFLTAFGNVVMFGGEDNTLTPSNETWIWDRYAGPTGTWTQSSPATSPPARFDHAMAQDQLGNHIIAFGGSDGSGTVFEGTWLWNGVNWQQILAPPSARNDVGMAYDSTRAQHVMFGGGVNATVYGETWELDGLNWHQRSPANAPTPRTVVGMAFDSARNQTVLYGGFDVTHCSAMSDTWEWGGQNWVQRITPTTPPPAAGIQPAFDSVRSVTWMLAGSDMWGYDGLDWRPALPPRLSAGSFAFYPPTDQLVLFGGQGVGQPTTNATWEWSGDSWTRRSTTNSPSARRSCSMAFDSISNRLILFGGFDGSAILGDTWAYDGLNWTQLTPTNNPPVRADHALVRDSARNRLVLFGGTYTSGTTQFRNDTWEWNGSDWQSMSPANAPSPRSSWMAFDSSRNRVVLFGGYVGSGVVLGDTWEYDGTNWTQIAPATTSPPARRTHQMATDPVSGCVMVFGGWNGSGTSGTLFSDTWTWDGIDWTPRIAPGPTARADALMAAHPTRGVTAMVGGITALSPATFSGETWHWNGTTWSLANRGSLPQAVFNYGAAYDQRRDQVVVFGGQTDCSPLSPTMLGDTWTWNGASWQQRFPTNSPSPRAYAKMTYDAARDRVVLYGGTNGVTSLGDTWEWDGDDWSLRLPSASPPAGGGTMLSYDHERRVTVAFGIVGAWDYGPEFPANIDIYGIGCPGPNGVPALQPKPWAGPWLGGRIEVDLINAPSNGLGIFVWGFSETFWSGLPLPLDLGSFVGGAAGCQLFASADITQIFLAGTNPYVSFVLPTQPVMNGVRMRAQAGFLPVGTPPVVSNALRMTFGSK